MHKNCSYTDSTVLINSDKLFDPNSKLGSYIVSILLPAQMYVPLRLFLADQRAKWLVSHYINWKQTLTMNLTANNHEGKNIHLGHGICGIFPCKNDLSRSVLRQPCPRPPRNSIESLAISSET